MSPPELAKEGPVLGRLLLSVTCRLRGSRCLEMLPALLQQPFQSPDEVRRRQFSQLKAMLEHAESKVPYYRELFGKLGITSRDIRSLEDYSRLPILTKEILREREKDLVREDVPLHQLLPHYSGGSTGVPLRFYRSRDYLDASDAGNYRNLMQCGWRPGEMIAFIWGSNDKLNAMPRWEFELRQFIRRSYQFDPFQSSPEDMARWIRRCRTLKPRVVSGYTSTIARLAGHLNANGQTMDGIRGVFTTAEKLFPQQRLEMERAFQCRVFDCYGSSEVQNIAAECSHGRMHINADYVVVEQDEVPQPGVPPPLLLTSLWNRSMPFLRYRNEDCGSLLNEVCDCGNHFPLMRLDIARVSDNFILPNGRVVHGEFFTHLMYGAQGIGLFQFHQTAVNSITLWIVPVPGNTEARQKALDEAVRQIQALSPQDPIQIEVRQTESIPLTSAGKHRFTRSDVTAQFLQSGSVA